MCQSFCGHVQCCMLMLHVACSLGHVAPALVWSSCPKPGSRRRRCCRCVWRRRHGNRKQKRNKGGSLRGAASQIPCGFPCLRFFSGFGDDDGASAGQAAQSPAAVDVDVVVAFRVAAAETENKNVTGEALCQGLLHKSCADSPACVFAGFGDDDDASAGQAA